MSALPPPLPKILFVPNFTVAKDACRICGEINTFLSQLPDFSIDFDPEQYAWKCHFLSRSIHGVFSIRVYSSDTPATYTIEVHRLDGDGIKLVKLYNALHSILVDGITPPMELDFAFAPPPVPAVFKNILENTPSLIESTVQLLESKFVEQKLSGATLACEFEPYNDDGTSNAHLLPLIEPLMRCIGSHFTEWTTQHAVLALATLSSSPEIAARIVELSSHTKIGETDADFPQTLAHFLSIATTAENTQVKRHCSTLLKNII